MGNWKFFFNTFGILFLIWYASVAVRNSTYDYRSPVPIKSVALVVYDDETPPFVLAYIQQLMESVFSSRVEVVQGNKEDFRTSYVTDRDQYDADHLLKRVEGTFAPYDKVVVILHDDIYGENANYLLGMAHSIPAQSAVVTFSRYRLGLPGFYEGVISRKILRSLTLHEIGHTLGLEHCEVPGCAMKFSNSILQEIRKGDRFCSSCEKRLLKNGYLSSPSY